MSRFDLALGVALFGLTARQVLVLRGVWRSHRFLSPDGAAGRQRVDVPERQPRFYVVLPVLREAPIITSTVDHIEGLLKGHPGAIVVVTTAREEAEGAHVGDAADTVRVVEELARAGRCIHLHYPDPTGLKADQLNLAANYCRSMLGADVDPSRGFLVCYDADSRPPLDSLDRFARAVAQHPDVDVFHQSSRFELRGPPGAGGRRPASGLARVIADGGALRANRFVLGYEIPRLLAGTWRGVAHGLSYRHRIRLASGARPGRLPSPRAPARGLPGHQPGSPAAAGRGPALLRPAGR